MVTLCVIGVRLWLNRIRGKSASIGGKVNLRLNVDLVLSRDASLLALC